MGLMPWVPIIIIIMMTSDPDIMTYDLALILPSWQEHDLLTESFVLIGQP